MREGHLDNDVLRSGRQRVPRGWKPLDPIEMTGYRLRMASPLDRRPVFNAPRFVCPHLSCGAFAQQTWIRLMRPNNARYDGPSVIALQTQDNDPFDTDDPARWHGAECGSCQQMSIWLDREMVYPSRHQLGNPPHPDLPPDVRDLYTEAAQVAVPSRRAGAALARAAVEKLLRHLDPDAPKSASLDKRIDRIRPRVSATLAKMLEVIRVSGNGAVHVDDEPDDIVVLMLDEDAGPELIEWMLDTINNLADELITRPRQADELFAKLPDKVRAKYPNAAPAAGLAADPGGPPAL